MAKVLFRAGVVIVVGRRDDGRILAFERRDNPGQWQLPQGGIEDDETPTQAAFRELAEETGLRASQVVIVGEHPEWTAYEWPEDIKALKQRSGRGRTNGGRIIGQVHRWFFVELLDPATEPRPDDDEFADWRWVEPVWLVEQVAPMRRAAYEQVLEHYRRADD